MKNLFKLLLLIVLLSAQNISYSQSKIDGLIYNAKVNYSKQEYSKAIENLNAAYKLDQKKADIYYVYFAIYKDLGKGKDAETILIKAIKNLGDTEPDFYAMLAYLEYQQAKYAEAKANFTKFINIAPKNDEYAEDINVFIKSCDFAIEAMKNPVPFNPVNLGGGINSKLDEYLPSINVEENEIVFTRNTINEEPTYVGDDFQEDFFVSYKIDTTWGSANPLQGNINSNKNEGAQSLSVNGKYLFFSGCNRDDGIGQCDIYFSQKQNGVWTTPVVLSKPLNSEYWDSHPSISADNKSFYFSSDRPGGYGAQDIWMCTIDNKGQFSEPKNLGSDINTSGSEMFPFIHSDNKTLYFTSDKHIGMGGNDIFVTHKENDEWTTPKNLGYPINTSKDENSLIVNAKGTTAYFSSNRDGGIGGIDLYKFNIYDEIKPQPITYLKGIIKDEETKKPLQAIFELYDLDNNKLIKKSYSSSTSGEFLILVPGNKNYMINVNKENYIFYSDNFSLKDNEDEIFYKTIELQKVKAGNKLVLKNIFFETNSYKLKDASKLELAKLQEFMNKYNTTKIQIEGYTDNVGSDEANQLLSENRAKEVMQHLIEKGINKDRLSYIGFGEKNPIADNNTKEGRKNNRRTEFKIISK